MPLARIANFTVRGFQVLFSAVVLGISLTAVRWQKYGSVPATNGYSVFAGGIALLAGLAGLASCFMLKLEKPMLLVDSITAALIFAAGIAYAIQLKGVDCSDPLKKGTYENKLINGGTKKYSEDSMGYGYGEDAVLEKRCSMAEANTAFLFLAFLMAVAGLVLGVLAFRKAKRSYGVGSVV